MQCSWDTAEEIVTIFLQGWFVLLYTVHVSPLLANSMFHRLHSFPLFQLFTNVNKACFYIACQVEWFCIKLNRKSFFFIQRSIVLSWEKFYLLISQHFWPQYRTCKSISDSCQLQWSWWCKLQQPFIWIKCLRKISETTPPRRLNACDLQ